ncbi:molybdenum cofactor cytidylyltransferase [Paeniclostridium sp. NSJ-45]|uniref:Molybdenum cofactor cytidylyltransferase n=1 Tax=Paeniclostridium hominis TaxID=2764329 RepID=A0ABR7K2F9_9FIRM|nr:MULTISPECIES: molybdenum cofactor cytidylyltransferase [Paeniclostridium]MBC6003270.1 molybdenum cofactor cytidylyltransferase [Paeniclostridium hominis]
MINAIVMASGFSTRMGNNKLLLEYRGKTIIENTLDILKKSNFKEIIVVSQYEEVLSIASKYSFKTVLNKKAYLGQSESIKLGIKNSSECEGYMFFVGDQPLLNKMDIDNLIRCFKDNNKYIIIPKYENKTGNPVIFPKCLKNKLLMLKNDEKGKKVISEYDKIKYIYVKRETLLDIDTKKDYENLINIYNS